ncbi:MULTISPECIES: hypothetical protein [Desulfobacula]|nr:MULTISPECIES: hypothetical protein [Desulfobacula]
MKIKICHNCGEKLNSLTEKCPKCGIIPKTSIPPALIGIAVVIILLLIVIAGLILL